MTFATLEDFDTNEDFDPQEYLEDKWNIDFSYFLFYRFLHQIDPCELDDPVLRSHIEHLQYYI